MADDVTPPYRAVLDQLVQEGPQDPAGRQLGWRGTHWEEGVFELTWEGREAFTNDGGVIHGGVLTMLLDTAMGLAVGTVMQQGEAAATADLHLQFLRPVPVGRLTVRGTLVRRTRQLAFCEGQVLDAHGTLLLRGAGTFAVILLR